VALASTLLRALRLVLPCADRGHAMALRAAAAAASAMAAIVKYCTNQQISAISEAQSKSLAAAIEVEILLKSWRARHQPPERET
jgi:hypothetical protein